MKRLFVSLVALLPAFIFLQAQNPYLPLWEHVPDGEPRVFEDPDNPGNLRAYIIGSHDVLGTGYCGPDIRMWSAPVDNLTQWRDEGPIFSWYIDGQWDTMFAPDLVETVDKNTGKKTYWLYPHSRGWGRVPMVCRGDRPDGPFTPVNLTADGTRCLPGSIIDFDPSVFIEQITDRHDPDFSRGWRAYVYYGFRHSTAVELDPETMYSARPGTPLHDFFLPASSRYGEILDPEGTEYPTLCKGQDPRDFNFFEASSIRQVGNKYVMVFSGYSGPDYGLPSTNSALRYAYGDSPLGPWRSGGVLVDSRGVVPSEDGTHLITTNFAHNTHGSLQQINGQWYVFYHRPPRCAGIARQAMVAPVHIEYDKKSVAKGGQVRITAADPFSSDGKWQAASTDGHTYLGAEVTSEGFQIFGLPPYAVYSAGIACHISGNEWLQDNRDVWYNGQDLCGITDRGIVGFKYFGFGGLDKSDKGLPPFEGTQPGNGTTLSLHLTPGGHGAFKIHVLIDGPWVNSVWNGRELGVIQIPAAAPRKPSVFTLQVPEVDKLEGKHAIYLVCEGPEVKPVNHGHPGRPEAQPSRPEGLFDLHHIGFAKDGKACAPPVVPTMDITVDGKSLRIPSEPLLFTNANGYAENNRYQLYAPITDTSVIQAKASDSSVKIEISKVNAGRATVTATYNGQKKIFLIN